jgi:serine acetyltransferase
VRNDAFILCERNAATLRQIKRHAPVKLTRLTLHNAPLAEDATLNLPCSPGHHQSSQALISSSILKERRMVIFAVVAGCIACLTVYQIYKNAQGGNGVAQQHIGLHGTLIEPRK